MRFISPHLEVVGTYFVWDMKTFDLGKWSRREKEIKNTASEQLML